MIRVNRKEIIHAMMILTLCLSENKAGKLRLRLGRMLNNIFYFCEKGF